mgnify:CR=1 FL=1
MTTILAVRDTLEMWSDTRLCASCDRQQDNYQEKIHRVRLHTRNIKSLIDYNTPVDVLIGFSGEVQCGLEFVLWCKEGLQRDVRPSFPVESGFRGLILFPDTKLYTCENRCFPIPQNVPYYVIGSGQEYCHGALSAGASPQMAMEVASVLDINSGLPLHRLSLKE